MKKSKRGTKAENSVCGVSKSRFRMSTSIKQFVETLCKMVLKSNSSTQKKLKNPHKTIQQSGLKMDQSGLYVLSVSDKGNGKFHPAQPMK